VCSAGGEWCRTPKTHPMGACFRYPAEGEWREWMGGRGAKHIEHAQTGVFNVFEGGHKVEEAPNMKTSPSGLVFVFCRWGGAGV